MSLRKRILINAGSNWAGMVVVLFVGILLVPIILKSVGVEGYGVWALLARGLSYVAILDRAFVLAVSRFAAFYSDDIDQRNKFISASFFILAACAFLTVLGAVLISFVLTDIFRSIPMELKSQAQVTCILVGITFAVRMFEANFSGALMGYQYYTRSNAVLAVSNIIRLGITVVVLIFWKSIIAVQAAFLAAAIISMLSMYIVAKISLSNLRISLKCIDRSSLKELLSYISHSMARSGSSMVMYNTMTLLVGWRGTASDVAVYDIAFRLPSVIRGFIAGVQNVFLPTVTNLHAKKEDARIKAVVSKGTHMSTVLTGMSCIWLFLFAESFLALWLGDSVPARTAFVMQMIIISVVPGGLFEIWLPTLVGMGHLKGLTLASIAMAAGAIFTAGFLLMQGLVEVTMAPALALVIVLWLRAGFWLPVYGLYKLKMKPLEYFKEGLAKSLIASLLSVVLIRAWAILMPEAREGWVTVLIIAPAIIVTCFAGIAVRNEVVEGISIVKEKLRSQKGTQSS